MLELLSLLALAAAPTEVSAQASAVVESRPISRVWLRAEGAMDADALADAVAARLTGKQVLQVGADAGPGDGPAALCHVSLARDGRSLQLEVILGDGRVYQRRLAAPAEGSERAAARLIAATLAAIEDATATPDRRDGVFVAPGSEVAEAPEPVLVPESPGVADAARAPERPVVEKERERALAPPVREQAIASVKPRAIGEPTLELGVALALGAGLGLGAPATGVAGGGGGLRLDLRLPRGVVLGAGFRGHTRGRDELTLGRYRGALLAGYSLRRGGFELVALAGASLETWQVTRRGAPVVYAASGPDGASLLLGGLARLALGGRVAARQRPLSARFGGFVELAGSARSSGRAARISRRSAEGAQATVFVLGGAELAIGVEVELWIGLRRARR